MIVCVDIGNTNIVVGFVENKKILNTYRFVTDDSLTVDDYYQKLTQLTDYKTFEGAIVSSVVPSLDHIYEELFEKYFHCKTIFIGPGIKSGLKIKLEDPKQLGADLLCDAVGAYQNHGGPVAIVDLGTASKIIVVNDKKEFLGGVISPGINGSLNALVASAAKLSKTSLKCPSKVIGNDTASCIQSGLIYGHAAMIDGLIERIKDELNAPNLTVVLTGGLGVVVKDIIKTKVVYNPNILIEGLIYLYYKNCNI